MTDAKRKALRNRSARALLCLAGILVLAGAFVISPAGRMFFLFIAAICAGISTLLCRGRTRTIGIVLKIAIVLMLVASYPAYKKHMDHYLDQAGEQSATTPTGAT